MKPELSVIHKKRSMLLPQTANLEKKKIYQEFKDMFEKTLNTILDSYHEKVFSRIESFIESKNFASACSDKLLPTCLLINSKIDYIC